MVDPTEERLERIEQGLHALFATEVATEILDAVDFEAILAAEPAEDPVDVDRLAQAIGRPVGRAIASWAIDGDGTSAVAKRAIGAEIGGRVTAKTFRTAVESVDTESVVETAVELDEETLPGPAISELVGEHFEELVGEQFEELVGEYFEGFEGGDVFAFELPDDADAGPDASGVHDAAGGDNTGVLDEADDASDEDDDVFGKLL